MAKFKHKMRDDLGDRIKVKVHEGDEHVQVWFHSEDRDTKIDMLLTLDQAEEFIDALDNATWTARENERAR